MGDVPQPGRRADVAAPNGYRGSVTSTKLKVSGIDVFSAGDFSGGEGCEDIVLRDATRGVYKRVIVKDDRVVGAVLYGDTADGNWYFDLLKKQEDIVRDPRCADLRPGLRRGGGALANPLDAVAALSDDAEICGCNGVSKGKVMACIGGGAADLDAVRVGLQGLGQLRVVHRAGRKPARAVVGDDVAGERTVKPMCKCTSFTHEDVRQPIVEKRAESDPASDAGAELDHARWLRLLPPGAQLLSAVRLARRTPVDDQQSRFVNERMHANIQKDGTYSVVPRMWGGVTTPNELRAIADACDKYEARMVKVTGGQRLDMFGIKKEDLPADLGRSQRGRAWSAAMPMARRCAR